MTNVIPLKRPMRAGISARISLSTEESVSIERQLQAGRDYCKAKGWAVVAEAVDESVSATKVAPEKRKGLGGLIARRQELDVIVGWKVDRLARSTLDFLTMHKLLDADGCTIATTEDHIDLSTSTGKAFATILSVFAEMEAANISARVRGANEYLLSVGRQRGGRRPWAFDNVPNPDGPGKVLRPNPERAPAIIDVYEHIMRGGSMLSACKVLDERGLPPTSRAGEVRPWRTSSLIEALRSPSLCGARVRDGKVVRNPDGTIRIDEESAILSLSQWLELQDALATQKRGPSSGKLYLLSGLLRCSGCGGRMSTDPTRKVYACSHERCPQKVSIKMDLAEQVYMEAWLQTYGPAHQGSMASVGPDPAEMIRLTEALSAAQEELRDTRDKARLLELFDLQERLEADLSALQDARVSRPRLEPYDAPQGRTWAEAYGAARTVEDRREVLLGIGRQATILPGTRGGNPAAKNPWDRFDFSDWD